VVRWAIALLLPVAGYVLLIDRPNLDVAWENHRAHFWLVLALAAVSAVLGFLMSEAAQRRRDARIFLVGLAFLSSAGFLGLHALATPGVVLSGKNTGFVLASPVGLTVASVYAFLSSLDLDAERNLAVMRHQRLLRGSLVALLTAWAAVSLASVPPLDEPLPPNEADGWLLAFAIVGVPLYAFAAWRYLALYRRRPLFLLVAVTAAFVLLGEALVAVAFARNWHATWWEWHLLMAAAFVLVTVAARQEYRRRASPEGAFAGMYLEHTIARVHDDYGRALATLAEELDEGADTHDSARAVARRFGLSGDETVLLERAAAQIRDVDELFRPYVPEQLAERLREDREVARLGGVERTVSVLFADLQGFTSFSEHADPTEVISMLNEYWGVTVPVVVREYGGLIERFAGDAVMVVFNAALDQPDHALRAVGAALEMQRVTEATAARRPGWPRFRAGVNTGTALVGNVGAAGQQSFSAIGDTVNVAARLQTAAEAGRVVLGARTVAELGDAAAVEPLGPLDLKGKSDPVEAFVLVRLETPQPAATT
jgi:class 3 adenylate cyclase